MGDWNQGDIPGRVGAVLLFRIGFATLSIFCFFLLFVESEKFTFASFGLRRANRRRAKSETKQKQMDADDAADDFARPPPRPSGRLQLAAAKK